MQSGKYYGYGRGQPDEAKSTRLLTLSQCVSGASECLKRGVSPLVSRNRTAKPNVQTTLSAHPPVRYANTSSFRSLTVVA